MGILLFGQEVAWAVQGQSHLPQGQSDYWPWSLGGWRTPEELRKESGDVGRSSHSWTAPALGIVSFFQSGGLKQAVNTG